jgi:thiol:disulfide interchange protein DsbD
MIPLKKMIGSAVGLATLLLGHAAWADGACRWAGAGSATTGAFGQALAKGPLYAGLGAWLAGLAVSLTPCVYPMIAVTVSIFGATQAKSRSAGAGLSASFVLGIVAMFVPLGVAAGLTGSMMSVATPCTGPFLTGMLAWIAQTGSGTYGALSMLAFALGLGLPFFLVGAFAIQLPKSGKWMVHVKSALGLVMVVVALYFAGTALPWLTHYARPTPAFLGGAALAVLLGLGLGAVHRSFADPRLSVKLGKSVGILLAGVGAQQLIVGALMPTTSLTWKPVDFATARAEATGARQPLLVDFTAAWCVACKELDKRTFSDPSVAREAGRFLAVKVDMTQETTATETVKEQNRVAGLPTVIAFDSTGKEAVRCTDFVPAREFLRTLERVR